MNQVIKTIHDGGLLQGVSHKGYQATYQECMKIVKVASSRMPKGGQMEVDLTNPAVYHIWDNVRYIMNVASAKMHPFLKLFGIVDGNGLSPFAANIETTNLLIMVKKFFKPPKHDLHGFGATNDSAEVDDVT